MLVETFEIEEVYEGVDKSECDEATLGLIESLELEGQRKLVQIDDDGSTTLCPYPKMTDEQKKVIRAVCPTATRLSEYGDQVIPLRVLQVAAHAKDMFEQLYVWHPQNADEKDPYLIGRNGDGYRNTEYFLLARWGDELLPWGEMVKKAGEKMRLKRLASLREILAKVRGQIEATEQASVEECAELEVPSYYSN